MVIVERKSDDKVKLHQPSAAGAGAATGALWGGLIGLIFLNPLLGMAFGAAGGRGRRRDGRLRHRRQVHEAARHRARARRRGLLLLIRKVSIDKVLPKIKIQGKVIQTSLDNETESRLSDALAAAGQE